MTSVKSSRLGSTNTTEKIMREFGQQKENCRLVNRIMNMSSSISMKKYMKDYLNHKSMMKIHVRARKSSEALCFRFFDIRFFHSVAQPDDIYRVYHVSNTKKKLLVEMTLFELRKTKLRIPKGQPAALKI